MTALSRSLFAAAVIFSPPSVLADERLATIAPAVPTLELSDAETQFGITFPAPDGKTAIYQKVVVECHPGMNLQMLLPVTFGYDLKKAIANHVLPEDRAMIPDILEIQTRKNMQTLFADAAWLEIYAGGQALGHIMDRHIAGIKLTIEMITKSPVTVMAHGAVVITSGCDKDGMLMDEYTTALATQSVRLQELLAKQREQQRPPKAYGQQRLVGSQPI